MVHIKSPKEKKVNKYYLPILRVLSKLYGLMPAVLLIALLLVAVAFANPGDLDTTFGAGGKVITSIGGFDDYIFSAAIQNDGKIVVAGSSNNGSNDDFALARYNSDGSLDTGFGTGGKVTTPIGSGRDYGVAAAIQTDGKIVVAGASNNGNDEDFALVRYNSEGSLDTTFGTGGIVTTPISSYIDSAYAVAIHDSIIVTAGYCWNSSTNNYDFCLARYNSDGSLDTTFGTGGKVITSVGSGDEAAYGVAIQDDGKIVAIGASWSSTVDFSLARFNSDGSLDTTFGTDGKVLTTIGSGVDYGSAVVIQEGGKIVVAGYSNNGSNDDFALVRYNSDGNLDPTFGTGGKVTTPIGNGNDHGAAVALLDTSKIVVAGYSNNGSDDDFALVRYNSDGSLDTTFGAGGKVTTPIGNGNDYGSAVALQDDGKLVMAGYFSNGTNYDFAVTRYNVTDEDDYVVYLPTVIRGAP
jgi:uncharacterized delta-60 repeat protein